MLRNIMASLNIYKIESNPLLIKVIKKDFNEFSGGIYSQNTWSGLGRSWLKYSDRHFDIIDIPMTGTAPSGSFRNIRGLQVYCRGIQGISQPS